MSASTKQNINDKTKQYKEGQKKKLNDSGDGCILTLAP
jgi:hypothetical protein